MTMMQDGFCGNCGLARPPLAVVCPRCGVPFEASGTSYDPSTLPLQAPTQVASTPPQASWQSSPTYFTGTPPPSAPASQWATRLLIGQGVIVVVLLAVILVVLLHPFAGGNSPQPGESAVGSATSTPTVMQTAVPTLTPPPNYVGDLASTDPDVFAHALGEALQSYDAASIVPHVHTTQFEVFCDEGNTFQGTCDTSWVDVQTQITARTLLIDVLTQGLNLQNTSAFASYCPGLTVYDSYILIGSFEQETAMPLAHLGRAILALGCLACGSAPVQQWAWDAVYFC